MTSTGFGWDPENRLSYATWGGKQYAYDGMNKRTWAGNYNCPGGFCGPGYGWQFQSETVFFHGIDGKRLASYTPQVQYAYGAPQSVYYLLGEERVYFGSKYIGNANTSLMSGGTSVGQDRLGSTGRYFPYGEERNNPQLPNDIVKFATYTRDSATGLDYADQRYFTSGIGRFLSPDPYGGSANAATPQSWNRYAYGAQDPVNRNDPAGLLDVAPAFDPGPCDFTAAGGGCYTGIPTPHPGGSSLCMVDGFATDCHVAMAMLQAGAAMTYAQANAENLARRVPLSPDEIKKQQREAVQAFITGVLRAKGVSDDGIAAFLNSLTLEEMDGGHLNLGGSWEDLAKALGDHASDVLKLLENNFFPSWLGDNGHRFGGLFDSGHDHVFYDDKGNPTFVSFHMDMFNSTFIPFETIFHLIVDFELGKLPGACLDAACRKQP